MNLVLFEPHELPGSLPIQDRRAQHVLQVLRRRVGDSFDAGIINGPRGKATLRDLSATALALEFSSLAEPPPPEPITLLAGLPRPQTARDILRDATSLGVAALHFIATQRGESSYAQSTLWSSGEWRRQIILGAEQAFTTRIPEVSWGRPLAEACAALPATTTRLALDNYEAPAPLSASLISPHQPLVLALGPERGWGQLDRDVLRASGFAFHHLGARVLRTETACIAALTLVRSKLGLM